MKIILKLVFFVTSLVSPLSFAEVVTDGSLGAVQNLSGQITIPQTLGTTVGNNLFHSFGVFNINNNESVTFTGADSLKNVISRVTGGQISNINGLLQSNIAHANFYFINPAGVTFGANAQVNVPAAFHVSSANQLNFSDGSHFSATTAASSLSIATPTEFGFLGNQAGDIHIQSERYYVEPVFDEFGNETPGYYVGDYLHFDHANTISFTGGNIFLDHASIITPSSDITFKALQQLSLTNNSVVDNSTDTNLNAGNMTLVAPQILIENSKVLSNANVGSTGNAGQVDIQAQKLIADGGGIPNNTLITSRTYSTGDAGTLTVNSDQITVKNFAFLSASTYNLGDGGLVRIDAKELTIDTAGKIVNNSFSFAEGGKAGDIEINSDNITVNDGGQISSLTFSTGNAGNITIQAKKLVVLTGESIDTGIFTSAAVGKGGDITINSDAVLVKGQISSAATFGGGNAGNILISGTELRVDGGSINSTTGSEASAGNIVLRNDKLIVNNVGIINTSTTGDGNAGNINIEQAKELIIANEGRIQSKTEFGAGNAGTINIQSEKITLASAGRIDSTTDGSLGKAGNINLTANTIDIYGTVIDSDGHPVPSQISSAATSSSAGQAGTINITAQQGLHLYDGGKITIQNDATVADPSLLTSGVINISAADITLKDAVITAAATGNVDAGQINLQFSNQLRLDPSFITTSANLGNGGNISVTGGQLIQLQNSGFLTSVADANGNGGNITVSAHTLLMDNGVIQANAAGGKGGNINLNLQALIPSHDLLIKGGLPIVWQPFVAGLNVIQAASATGVSGNINLSSPQFNISGSISGLDSAALALPTIDTSVCQNTAHLVSTLARGGKGGIPNNEAKHGFIPPSPKNGAEKVRTGLTVSPLLRSDFSDHATTEKEFPCAAL